MSHLKRTRASEEHKIDDGNDILSHLPDCVLHHILSYVPTMDAVATCVLSKRWETLWAFVPIIDVDDLVPYTGPRKNGTQFINFVDTVLRLRSTSSMKKFRLCFRDGFSASRVNDWVSAAIRQNVEELDLHFYADDDPLMLPCCVFDNAFIKVLKIEPYSTLRLPPRISLPYLKSLHLSQVTFPSDDLMQRLFCGCPSLEELNIFHCDWNNMKNIAVATPSLKTLVISDSPSFYDLPGCEVKIDAINLVTFEYSGWLFNEINVLGLSLSAVPSIEIPRYATRHEEIGPRTFKLLSALRNVSSLRINTDVLLHVENMLVNLPVFRNLIHLELRGEPERCSSELLTKFLQFSPKLEVLHLCGGRGWVEDDFTLELVPECISSRLKIVNFHDLRGTNREISVLKSLLQLATVLEKMYVFYPRKRKYKDVRNELLAVPRGSNNCVLMFP